MFVISLSFEYCCIFKYKVSKYFKSNEGFKSFYFENRYEYTHTTNRLWRKNRAGSKDVLGMLLPLCAGVDLNRNFGYQWGGVSLDPRRGTSLLCLETYMGTKPFSEAESNAIRRFIKSKPAGTFDVSDICEYLFYIVIIKSYRCSSSNIINRF